ncbi:MAG TPA: alpha-galactosidase [Thermoanaerobaculia bacterium]|nr:alpha-galactosidase [Thermoanaerobaculia bacterium]
MCRTRALCWLVLSGLLQAARPVAGAGAYVSFEAESRTWRIGNAVVERAVRLDEDGHFVTAALLDKRTGRDWTPPETRSAEFRVVFVPAAGRAPDDPVIRTGLSTWTFLSEAESVEEDGSAGLDVRLLDAESGVAVTVHYRCFPDASAIRGWLDVANEGPVPVRLTAADALHLQVLGDGSEPQVFWVRNFTWDHPAGAFTTRVDSLLPGEKTAFSTGPFGEGAAWVALQGTARGSGLYAGWEWSGTGSFEISAGRRETALVNLGVGLADGHFSRFLAPGQSFTAPAGFVGVYSGGWDGAARATRQLVERRYAPALPDPTFPWVGFDTWGYGLAVDEGLVGRLIDTAAGLGAETFTLDAGWMERIGDWRPRPGAFDGGIGALSDHAHARGLRFGLWMAFGVADPGSEVVQTHPDWVATDDGEPIRGDFGAVVLCLGNPAVRAWAISEIDRVVSEYGVDWLLHDFTVIAPCTNEAHGHQAGDGEWATTAGYYAVLDEVRRRHPKLVIENCWNGGSMMDFGMVRRHDTSNTSDYNSALTGRRGAFGTTYFLPPRYAGKYIGDDGTPPEYRFASGLPGGPLLLMGRPDGWDGATADAARGAIALFKELRPVLRDGAIAHVMGPPATNGWDGYLAWDAEQGEGILLAFRGADETPEMTLFPRGLPDGESLELLCDAGRGSGSLAGGLERRIDSGRDLRRLGIGVRIPSPEGVAVIRLTAIPPVETGRATGR